MEVIKKSLYEKIVFIGGGMMAEAIIAGMLKSAIVPASNIVVVDVNKSRREHFSKVYKVKADDDTIVALKDASIVFLSIKPQVFLHSLDNAIIENIPPKAIVVSIMAGIELKDLNNVFPENLVIRVMPNTPLAVNEGMTVLSRGKGVDDGQLNSVMDIFKASGEAMELPENLLGAVTGVSGCGPGYLFVILDAFADAGVMAGLPRDIAIKLAAQTMCGAGRMALKTGEHPAKLRDQVTSPGGATIVGIATMEQAGIRGGIIDAVMASIEKARSLKN